MNQYNNIWGSFGYHHSNQSTNDVKVELNYEEPQNSGPTKNLTNNQRLEKQKERVYKRTIDRLLSRRDILENERLQYAYRDGVDVAIAQKKVVDNFDEIMKRYQVPKENRLSQSERGKYHTDNDHPRAIRKENLFKDNDRRSRQTSASTKSEYNFLKVPENEDRPTTGKKPRIKSAPVSGMRNREKFEYFPDNISVFSDVPERGCCPADCRLLSDPDSVVNPSTIPGPCYNQHFLYKKYFLYKRPRSALVMRTNEFETELRKNCYLKIQAYTSIAQPCVLHDRYGSGRTPRSLSPRSPRSLGSSKSSRSDRNRVKQAWIDDDLSIFEGTNDDEQSFREAIGVDDGRSREEDGDEELFSKQPTPSLVSSRSGSSQNEGEIDELAESEVNLIGKKTFEEEENVSTLIAESKDLEDLKLEEEVLKDEEEGADLRRKSDTFGLDPEVFSGNQTASEEEDEEREGKVSGAPESSDHHTEDQPPSDHHTEAQLPFPTTDMLTGAVFQPGTSVSADTNLLKEGGGAYPISITIHIPDPLPVKHYPEPDVRTVDLVSPREDLLAHGSQLLDHDQPDSPDHADSLNVDTILDSTDMHPPSILKKSQESLKDKKVKFEVPTGSDLSPADEGSDGNADLHARAKRKGKRPQLKSDVVSRDKKQTPSDEADSGSKQRKGKRPQLKSDVVSRDKKQTPSDEADSGSKQKDQKQKRRKQGDGSRDTDVTGASSDKSEVDLQVFVQRASEPELAPDADTEEKSPPEGVGTAQSAVIIRTPKPDLEQSQTTFKPKELSKDLFEEPTDEYLRKLLAAPDLHDFVPPEFETPPVKTKKKKRPKSGKKKKGKKKSPVKIVKSEPEEPLFTYIPKKFEPEKVEEALPMKEETELNFLIAAVREYEDKYKEKMKNQPWLYGRMALSKQICRFWIPVDLRQLEGLSPSRYLTDYCIVCKRRQKLYSMAFERQLHKRKLLKPLSAEKKKSLSVKETRTALRDVHGNCISDADIEKVYNLVYIGEDKEDDPNYVTRVNLNLFTNMCALTERIFYNQFVTEDTEDRQKGHRDRLEAADFHGLKWKLNEVNVSKGLRRFLLSL